MSSRKVEDIHTKSLKKLLSDSGLVCIRPEPESLESESLTGESEEGLEEEGQEEIHSEPSPEEKPEQAEEVVPEELPFVFPTPSLRRLLPDRVREIEEQNRVHVLPVEFKSEIDPQEIPKIAHTPSQKYIDILAGLVGCESYKSSLAEFWFLDTLANLLRRAQEDEMNRTTQAILILWFCEWMKEMQEFDAADRKRMLTRFEENMLSAANFIGEEDRLPNPADAGVYYKAPEEEFLEVKISTNPVDKSSIAKGSVIDQQSTVVTFRAASYACALQDLAKIIHYIYDLFSTDYQYELVRSIFTFSPEYALIDAPYQIQTPKRMYAPNKLKPKKEKSPKKDAKGKKKKGEPDPTEEYLALMALKASDERERELEEEKDREAWNRKSHILPLTFAATDSLFDKYWPPPPPEPEPELMPQAEPKKKGKK